MPAASIRRLTLHNVRSYHAAQFELGGSAGPVVLTGPNGAGKTNRARGHFDASRQGAAPRALHSTKLPLRGGRPVGCLGSTIEGALGLATLGTGIEQQGREWRRRHVAQIPGRPLSRWLRPPPSPTIYGA